MDQGVFARHHLDEGAEGQDADDLAGVNLARLDISCHGRNAFEGGLAGLLVDRGDEDCSIVLDGDIRSGVLLQRANVAAAGTDELADLVLRHVDPQDARGVRRHLLARGSDAIDHHVHDLQARVACLVEGAGEDLEVDALDLHIHLQRGHAVAGTRDLEVHVAEVVLHADDVRQDGDIVLFLNQTHGDAGDRGLDRDAGVHHREHRSADGGHRGRAVGGQHF